MTAEGAHALAIGLQNNRVNQVFHFSMLYLITSFNIDTNNVISSR
jgi:hypothetical protein